MRRLVRRNAILGLGLLGGGFLLATTPRPIAAADVPLAIKGYDPVAYFSEGKPVRGMPAFAYEWDERSYPISRTAHREQSIADTVHSTPQFGNHCALPLDHGQARVAHLEHA